MMQEELNFRELEARIKRRYSNRTEILSNLVAFVATMLVVWVIWQPQDENLRMFLALGSVGWFIGVVVHGVVAFMKEAQERALERAISEERELRRSMTTGDYKTKRDRLTLSDDGEVLEVVEDPAEEMRR